MKKIISIFATIPIIFSFLISMTVFAAENADIPDNTTIFKAEEEVVPYGAISGYGQVWYDPNTMPNSGSFTFYVSGVDWYNAHTTLKFENFNPETKFDIEICNRNGTVVFRRQDIDMSFDDYDNLLINPGLTGTYTVYYKFYGTLSPGRINVWIF